MKMSMKLPVLLKEILYPEGAVCLCCGTVSDGTRLCPACREELLYSDMLSFWRFRDLSGVSAYSLRPHRGVARSLVLQLKHGAVSGAANELASVLLPLPEGLSFSPDTVVTFVPMPASRRRERCIDHGETLARAFADRLGLPCRPLLARTKVRAHTQEGLGKTRRAANLKGVFQPLEPIHFPVLLTDDVLTTGTTALRCIESLRSAGASEITVLTATYAI